MIRKLGWLVFLLLAGCAGAQAGNSACDPGSYQCQVDTYSKAGG